MMISFQEWAVFWHEREREDNIAILLPSTTTITVFVINKLTRVVQGYIVEV